MFSAVFQHTGPQVFITFVKVVPLKIALARRHKLDSHGGLVLSCIGGPPEPGPDHAVGAASAIGRANEVLGQSEVEGGPLGMMALITRTFTIPILPIGARRSRFLHTRPAWNSTRNAKKPYIPR